MLQRAKNRTATSKNAMMIKAVPICRVRGPVFLTGARQAFFCHACDASLSVSECSEDVIARAMTHSMPL